MGTWMNKDSLYIKYGTDEATINKAGSFGTVADGMMQVTDIVIDLTTLTDTAVIKSDSAVIPAGVFIAKVETIAETAATSSGSGTLDVGLIKLDRTTEIDFEGFVDALALTSIDAAGETTNVTAGDLFGTVTAFPGLITANYNTGAYQQGSVRVKIYWYKK